MQAEMNSTIETLAAQKGEREAERDESRKALSALEREVQVKSHQVQAAASEREQLRRELQAARTEAVKVRRHHRTVADEGFRRYEQLLVEGKATQWNKSDATLFWEYFSLVNPEVARQGEDEYDALSPSHKVIVVLMKLGRTNDEIGRTLGMSYGARVSTPAAGRHPILDLMARAARKQPATMLMSTHRRARAEAACASSACPWCHRLRLRMPKKRATRPVSGQQSSMARMDSPIHERGARPRSGSGSGSICAGSPLL